MSANTGLSSLFDGLLAYSLRCACVTSSETAYWVLFVSVLFYGFARFSKNAGRKLQSKPLLKLEPKTFDEDNFFDEVVLFLLPDWVCDTPVSAAQVQRCFV